MIVAYKSPDHSYTRLEFSAELVMLPLPLTPRSSKQWQCTLRCQFTTLLTESSLASWTRYMAVMVSTVSLLHMQSFSVSWFSNFLQLARKPRSMSPEGELGVSSKLILIVIQMFDGPVPSPQSPASKGLHYSTLDNTHHDDCITRTATQGTYTP